MAEVQIRSADGSNTRVSLSKPRTVLGRSRESDIFLPDQWLSRQHAEIRAEDGSFVLRDLQSKNGTLLNGSELVGEHTLRTGDVITLGEHVLRFVAEEAEEEEQAPHGTRVFSVSELSQAAVDTGDGPAGRAPEKRLLRVLMQGLAQALLEHRPLAEVFEQVLTLLLEAVPAERGAVLLLEGEPAKLVVKASRSRQGAPITEVSRSISRKVLADRVALLLPNLMEDDAFRAQDSILSSGIRSALCAPLWFMPPQGEAATVIGLVYLDSRQRSHEFTEEDVAIITALANVAAAKIENVRLLEESLEKRALEDDMRRAADIQRRLLPACEPMIAGWSFVGSNTPSRAVGGDYYDFLEHEGELLFALGDVSGKGTGAALLMAVLRAAVRAHWVEGAPADVVTRINRTVFQNIPEGKYVTFFFGRLDPATGKLCYVNAGHLLPVLVRANGSVESLDVAGGMVLGLFEGTTYEHGSAQMDPGDLLATFSDGVTETWSPDGEEFGDDRVTAALAAAHAGTARQAHDALIAELDVFSVGVRTSDDRTLILIKRE